MSLDCPEVEIARDELRRAIAQLRRDVGRAVREWAIQSVRRMLEASGAGDDVVPEALERAESEARAATATAMQDLSAPDAESALRPGAVVLSSASWLSIRTRPESSRRQASLRSSLTSSRFATSPTTSTV